MWTRLVCFPGWSLALLLCVGPLACKKDRNIQIDDTPKVTRNPSSDGRGDLDDDGKDPKDKTPEQLETDVRVEVKTRTEGTLSQGARIANARLALADMNAAVQGSLKTKVELAELALDDVANKKPGGSIKRFCDELRIFVDAVSTDTSLAPSNKSKIEGAYSRVMSKNEGLCATE